MKLFCRQSFCRECGVAFEPRKDDYDYLCLPHAKPKLEIDRRRRAVAGWAGTHWERLEQQMIEEQEKTRTAFNTAMQANLQAQAAAMRQSPINQMAGYGGVGGMLGAAFGSQSAGWKKP